MARCVDDLQAELADHQHVAVFDADIYLGRRAVAMHDHRYTKPFGQLLAGGKMIGVGMGVDHIFNVKGIARRQRKVVVELAGFGIDDRRSAGFGTADQVGLTTAGGYLFKDHSRVPCP